MSDLLTIAYITGRYPRASDSFVRSEVEAVRALGHRVHTFSVRRPDETELVTAEIRAEWGRTEYLLDATFSQLVAAGWRAALRHPRRMVRALGDAARMRTPGLRGTLLPFAYLLEAALLAERLRVLRVQHLHDHIAGSSAVVARLASTLSRVPYSLTVHGSHELEGPRRSLIDHTVADAKFAVAASEHTRAQILRFVPSSDWPKVHVVRCGLPASFLGQRPHPVPHAPRLVAVGRLDPLKGFPVLLDATAVLVGRGQPIEVFLIGDGPQRSELEATVERLGIASAVRLVGWHSDAEIAHALAGARALVIASFSEGLPMVAMEALSLRRPVVATSVGGIPELVRDGTTGWLVPPGSVDALADAMQCALAVDDSEIRRRGEAGRALVLERHDVRRTAERLVTLIRER